MDDARTQRTLDAIADLYLTGTTPGPGQPPVRLPPKLRMRQPPAPPTPTQADELSALAPAAPSPSPIDPPIAHHESSADESAGGPSSASASSASAGPARPWREVRAERRQAQQQQDDLDDSQPFPFPATPADASAHASADEAEASASGQADVPGVIRSQAVFLGNLPGFAGPWLAQYAQSQASGGHAVAVMHVNGQSIDLEVVYPLGKKPSPAAGMVPGMHETLIDVLDRLSRDAYAPVTRWLLHLPVSAQADVLAMSHDLDHWTLICGADEPAMTAGERWLGRLLQDDHRPERRCVSVAVMGSDDAKAGDVVRRLSLAGQGLLSQPVELALSRKQMSPVNIRSMGSFSPADELWQELLSYLSTSEPMAAPQAARPFAIPDYRKVESLQTAEPESVEAEELVDVSAEADSMEPALAEAGVAVAAADVAVSAAAPAGGQAGKAAVAQVEVEAELDLSQWLAGQAVALEARCPHHPDLQLALDAQGRLHVLAHHQTGQLSATLLTLQQAVRWAGEHLSLLKLTHRQGSFDLSASPLAHLFTSQSVEAASLAGKLGGDTRLHLLLEAHVGSQSTWVAAPLN